MPSFLWRGHLVIRSRGLIRHFLVKIPPSLKTKDELKFDDKRIGYMPLFRDKIIAL